MNEICLILDPSSATLQLKGGTFQPTMVKVHALGAATWSKMPSHIVCPYHLQHGRGARRQAHETVFGANFRAVRRKAKDAPNLDSSQLAVQFSVSASVPGGLTTYVTATFNIERSRSPGHTEITYEESKIQEGREL